MEVVELRALILARLQECFVLIIHHKFH